MSLFFCELERGLFAHHVNACLLAARCRAEVGKPAVQQPHWALLIRSLGRHGVLAHIDLYGYADIERKAQIDL